MKWYSYVSLKVSRRDSSGQMQPCKKDIVRPSLGCPGEQAILKRVFNVGFERAHRLKERVARWRQPLQCDLADEAMPLIALGKGRRFSQCHDGQGHESRDDQ